MPRERRQLVIDVDAAAFVRDRVGPIGWLVVESVAAHAPPGSGVVEVRCSSRSLAEVVGVSKDSVARAFRSLTDARIVERVNHRDEEVQAEIEPLVYRYNELADRKLKGPGTRSEMRDLRAQIGELSAGLDRLGAELDDARNGMREREQFQTDHAHDAGFLDALDNELDRQLRSRAWQIAADPTDYHLHILGPVPADPDHLATWMRGATVLDRHHLGVDRDTPRQERSSLLGGHRERAETMARLEVMAIPREPEPISRTSQRDLGLDLFG